MGKGSTFAGRYSFQLIALIVLLLASSPSPQSSPARTADPGPSAGLDAGAPQLSPRTGPEALDRPCADPCALSRKEDFDLAARVERAGAADTASASAEALLGGETASGTRRWQGWQRPPHGWPVEPVFAGAFASRGPPLLISL